MGSFNRVTLLGNLGADPEIRSLNSGDRVATMRIATTETWKQNGEKKERTDWHTVVIFNDKLVDVVERYLKKGSSVLVEGKLQTRSWEKDGEKRYATEVVIQKFGGSLTMVGGKRDGGDDGDRYSSHQTRTSSGGGFSGQDSRGSNSFDADLDDEIPF